MIDAESLVAQPARILPPPGEDRLRLALDASTIALVEADMESGEATATPSLFTMLGLPAPHEGRTTVAELRQCLHPDDRDRVVAALAAMTPHQPAGRSAHRILRAYDGAERWIEASDCVRADRDGRLRWIGVQSDITERRRLDEDLAANEERLRLAIAAGGFATWDAVRTDKDPDGGENVYWSDNYFTMLGYQVAPGGLASRSMWRQRVHPDDLPHVMAAWARAEAGDGTFRAQYRVRLPDGRQLWTEAHGRIIRLPDGRRRSVGLAQDITARRDAEMRLRALQEAAMRASRLNAVGAMAASLAHELNQPLGALANYNAAALRMLGRPPPGVPEAEPWLQAVQGALQNALVQTQRAASIVQRLRHFVGRSEPELSLVPVAQVVEEACAVARASLPSSFDSREPADHVRLSKQVAPDAGEVFCNREQLLQVLVNLICNAIEAVRKRAVRNVVVSGGRAGDGRWVQFSVADTGPGVLIDHDQQIFESFVSGKVGGMGIGLAICRTIVEAHGGRIWAAQADGGGAILHVVIPGQGVGPRDAP